jgi:ABC-type Fe3+-hydroxamate transport system substrate-binding protein
VLELAAPPRRIVSLVPSWTEWLFALGAGGALVGVTEFCVHPADGVARLPKVGGTKNPDIGAIAALKPELVIANREENRRRDVERLEAAGVRVFVTYARSVREALGEMSALARLTGRAREAEPVTAALESQLAARQAAASTRPKVVALVWRDPFMAVGGDTFADDLLRCAGGHNPFAGSAESRYPRVTRAELEAAAPDVLLLPSEPYRFEERDRLELLELDCPAARTGRVHLVEGELLSWYGPRMARALATLGALLGE